MKVFTAGSNGSSLKLFIEAESLEGTWGWELLNHLPWVRFVRLWGTC